MTLGDYVRQLLTHRRNAVWRAAMRLLSTFLSFDHIYVYTYIHTYANLHSYIHISVSVCVVVIHDGDALALGREQQCAAVGPVRCIVDCKELHH